MIVFHEGWSRDFDGPGQRLVFYLKGCNFRCSWCASPESFSTLPETLFYPERAKTPPGPFVCPRNALSATAIDRAKCADCETRDCARVWKYPGVEAVGEDLSPEDIVRRAVGAKSLFAEGGGVTFGGGEPTLWMDELLETLDGLAKNKIRVAIETNASAPDLSRLFRRVDLLICDLKAVSEAVHRRATGAPNATVLENLREAARNQPGFLVRVPCVRGVNDTPDEMAAIETFLDALRRERPEHALRVELSRQHHLGAPKYRALGIPYPMDAVEPPPREVLDAFARRLRDCGIDVGVFG